MAGIGGFLKHPAVVVAGTVLLLGAGTPLMLPYACGARPSGEVRSKEETQHGPPWSLNIRKKTVDPIPTPPPNANEDRECRRLEAEVLAKYAECGVDVEALRGQFCDGEQKLFLPENYATIRRNISTCRKLMDNLYGR